MIKATVAIVDAPSASRSLMTEERDMGRRELDPDTIWDALAHVKTMVVTKLVNFMIGVYSNITCDVCC